MTFLFLLPCKTYFFIKIVISVTVLSFLVLITKKYLFTFLSRKVPFFYFISKTEKRISCIFCSATRQVKGGYAAALFLTLTLLLTPIETVCQSNHAPSQTSPRVERECTSSTMLHCSLHIAYLPQRGGGFNKETIR